MLKPENIKSVQQIERFLEGCLNDFENGISTKEETINNLCGLMCRIVDVVTMNVNKINRAQNENKPL